MNNINNVKLKKLTSYTAYGVNNKTGEIIMLNKLTNNLDKIKTRAKLLNCEICKICIYETKKIIYLNEKFNFLKNT